MSRRPVLLLGAAAGAAAVFAAGCALAWCSADPATIWTASAVASGAWLAGALALVAAVPAAAARRVAAADCSLALTERRAGPTLPRMVLYMLGFTVDGAPAVHAAAVFVHATEATAPDVEEVFRAEIRYAGVGGALAVALPPERIGTAAFDPQAPDERIFAWMSAHGLEGELYMVSR